MTNDKVIYLKEELLKRKQALEDHLANFDDERETSIQEATGELSNYDNHPADIGTELYEREKDDLLHDRATEELLQIRQALERIEAGLYGICHICETTIPYERLEVVPWTIYCIHHAESHENKNNQIVAQSEQFHKTTGDETDSWSEVADYGTSDSED